MITIAKNGKRKRCGLFVSGVSLFLLCLYAPSSGCGGGYVPLPYIPTSSGNINTPTTRGSFFLIEKGSAGEMFDIKKLQPLFRNIQQSGNDRKIHADRKKVRADSGSVARSDRAGPDTARAAQATTQGVPVLNLHSIH
ncbi:MAG: hypothetical protein JXA71_13150 [Chitinispirillaceae bacterium]|nr:hypothetical protein [Chitinispirillaceae bacterium]